MKRIFDLTTARLASPESVNDVSRGPHVMPLDRRREPARPLVMCRPRLFPL